MDTTRRKSDLLSPTCERTWTVSELTGMLRSLLEEHFGLVRVVGEVSRVRVATSGHAYLTLKDAHASLPAVMFRSALARMTADLPEEGTEVECLGRVTLYEPRGSTQLVIEAMLPRGTGALGLKFLALKARLQSEGLFDAGRKRPLPFLPARIGLVTSPAGAALRDILKVLERRFPSVPVLLYPVRVQGEGAAEEIAAGIGYLGDGTRCDVLVIGRGGGSAEDLWAFNEEVVVRATVASRVPVISAVGHEVDLVLSDLAADARAATPTAAAEMVVPDREQLKLLLNERIEDLRRVIWLDLARARRHLTEAARRIRDPRYVLAAYRLRLDDASRGAQAAQVSRLTAARHRLAEARLGLASRDPGSRVVVARDRMVHARTRLVLAAGACLRGAKTRLEGTAGRLSGLDPLAVLARGFSVVSNAEGAVIRDSRQVAAGDTIEVRLHRGGLTGTVDTIRRIASGDGDPAARRGKV